MGCELADAMKLLRRWMGLVKETDGWMDLESSLMRRLEKKYHRLVEDTRAALEALERRGY